MSKIQQHDRTNDGFLVKQIDIFWQILINNSSIKIKVYIQNLTQMGHYK